MTFTPMRLELATDRLLLTPWWDVDLATYRALVAERGEGTPEPDDITRRLRDQRERYEADGIALLALRRKAEGDVIGYCGLVIGRSSSEEPELAYELFRHAHGSGFATEAARAVVSAARDTGRARLWATVRTWNAPSFGVLDKLGFRRDHTTADDRGEIVWCSLRLADLAHGCPAPADG